MAVKCPAGSSTQQCTDHAGSVSDRDCSPTHVATLVRIGPHRSGRNPVACGWWQVRYGLQQPFCVHPTPDALAEQPAEDSHLRLQLPFAAVQGRGQYVVRRQIEACLRPSPPRQATCTTPWRAPCSTALHEWTDPSASSLLHAMPLATFTLR